MRGVGAVDLAVALRLVHLLDPAGILRLHLVLRRGIANGWQVRPCTRSIVLSRGRLGRIAGLAVDGLAPLAAALPFVLALPLCLFLLLALFPLLADLLELYKLMLVKGANRSTSVHRWIPACKCGVERYSVNAKIGGSCCVTRLT